MDYAVLGDSVILAQRLESAAPKGETYVSDLTYRLTSASLRLRARRRADVEREERSGARLAAAGRTCTLSPLGEPERLLVGRASEFQRISGVLDGMAAGTGGIVVVTGEPGVGKSSLTEAVREAAKADGCRWLQTRCLSYGAGLAYWPYADLLRTVAGIASDADAGDARDALAREVLVAEAVPYFARLLDVAPADDPVAALEPEAFRRGLHEAFSSWLSAVAAERALVLALEDVHWADASSLELTLELARLCGEQPIVLLLTARPEAETTLAELMQGEHTVRLEPLDETGIEELVENALEGAAPAELVPWIVERTTGNPFFVEELLRALRRARDPHARPMAGGSCARVGAGRAPADRGGSPRSSHRPLSAARRRGSADGIRDRPRTVRVPLLAAVRADDHDLAARLETLVERGFLDRVPTTRADRRSTMRWFRTSRTRASCAGSSGSCTDAWPMAPRRCTARATTSSSCSHATLSRRGGSEGNRLPRSRRRARAWRSTRTRRRSSTSAAPQSSRERRARDRASGCEILLVARRPPRSRRRLRRGGPPVRRRARRDLRPPRLARPGGGPSQARRVRAGARRRRRSLRSRVARGRRPHAAVARAGDDLSVAGRFEDAIEVLAAGLDGSGTARDEISGSCSFRLARAELMSGRCDEALDHAHGGTGALRGCTATCGH